MQKTISLPELRISRDYMLPDSGVWQNRIRIPAEGDAPAVVVSQHTIKRYWGCTCNRFKLKSTCKHLARVGVPPNQQPHEVNLVKL